MPLATSGLIPPYGGRLVDLLVPAEEQEAVQARASHLPSLQLSERATCDLELLATGAFSPLDQFMGAVNHELVCEEMRLRTGHVFTIPVTLPIESGTPIHLGQEVALRDNKFRLLAVMRIEEIYPWDHAEVAYKVFGTLDLRHPLVAEMQRWGKLNIAGPLRVLQLPRHYDFQDLRLTPAQTRQRLARLNATNVVAFQTSNLLHRVHEELTKRAAAAVDGVVLLHPVVGLTQPGAVDPYTRVRAYKALTKRYYDPQHLVLALLPLAMRMAGPREALWHALIQRNYGANYFIVGCNYAGPCRDSQDKPLYGPYAAQELLQHYSKELGVSMIPFQELLYLPEAKRYEEASQVPPHTRTVSISGVQIRQEFLQQGKKLPAWFTRPEVADILQAAYPPRHQQGVCIWLTGGSATSRSTTAEILTVMLLEHGRRVSVLDNNVVRMYLAKGTDSSPEEYDSTMRRIGFVAAELARHGAVVLSTPGSMSRAIRNEVRHIIGADHFLEVLLDTPPGECTSQHVPGRHATRQGDESRNVTSRNDPYKLPTPPDVALDTVAHTPAEHAYLIFHELQRRGFIEAPEV